MKVALPIRFGDMNFHICLLTLWPAGSKSTSVLWVYGGQCESDVEFRTWWLVHYASKPEVRDLETKFVTFIGKTQTLGNYRSKQMSSKVNELSK